MRRGASGKQYLFLHISCLILQWRSECPEMARNMAARWQSGQRVPTEIVGFSGFRARSCRSV